MRPALLVLALLAAGCLAPDPASCRGEQCPRGVVDRGGWAEFMPQWREGPDVLTYNGKDVEVPEGVVFATDGASYLYATGEPGASAAAADPACSLTAEGGTWVLVSAPTCRWTRHPGTLCVETDVCERATGVRQPA